MTTYYWTLGFVFLLSFLADLISLKKNPDGSPLRKKPLGTKICLFLVAGIFIFVAGFRYYVGTDFGYYYNALSKLPGKLKESISSFSEPGFTLLATVISWFTKDGTVFVFACSLITIGLFLLMIYRDGGSYTMSSVLFMFLIWDGTFNGVRQYLASAILFCGYRFIYDKKLFKWIITVLLAYCFHKSALVMVVIYFLLRNKVSARNIALLAIGTYLVASNYDTLFSFIGFLKDETMVMNSYATKSVNVFRIMVSCAPAVLILILYLGKQLTPEQTFFTNALVMHAAAMVAASNSAYLARIGIYTSPYVVMALPRMLRVKNKYVESLMRVGVLVLYAIFWFIDISGSNSMNNFRFAF